MFFDSAAALRLGRTRVRSIVKSAEPRRTMHCAGRRFRRAANSAFRTAAWPSPGRRYPRSSSPRPCSRERARRRNGVVSRAAPAGAASRFRRRQVCRRSAPAVRRHERTRKGHPRVPFARREIPTASMRNVVISVLRCFFFFR